MLGWIFISSLPFSITHYKLINLIGKCGLFEDSGSRLYILVPTDNTRCHDTHESFVICRVCLFLCPYLNGFPSFQEKMVSNYMAHIHLAKSSVFPLKTYFQWNKLSLSKLQSASLLVCMYSMLEVLGRATSQVIGARNEWVWMIMIFGDLGSLKLPEFVLQVRKNLTQETCPNRESNPGPLRDRRACYHLLHSGGLIRMLNLM